MTFSIPLVAPAALATAPSFVQAQSAEAWRRINAQGVEVIQARAPAQQEEKVRIQKPAGTRVASQDGSAALVAADPMLQVSPPQQRSRDEGRLDILTHELAAESAALDKQLRILQSPTLRNKLSGDELKRLEETALDHEKNLRALNAEIGRARIAR